MGKAPKLAGTGFLALLLLAGVGLTGCTKHPAPEQMTQLEEACAAADKAEQTVSEREAELQRLQSELAQKQRTLQEVRRERATVESRLNALRSDLQQTQAEMARIRRERGGMMTPPPKPQNR
jgi:septal ring factor EnvC (AmiA/AmiB activator)